MQYGIVIAMLKNFINYFAYYSLYTCRIKHKNIANNYCVLKFHMSFVYQQNQLLSLLLHKAPAISLWTAYSMEVGLGGLVSVSVASGGPSLLLFV